MPEQGETLDERAAAHHQLGPTLREVVDRRILLEDADRIVRGQDRHGRAQADALRFTRGGRQHDGRRGNRVVRPVVFAQPVEIEAHLVGEPDLLHEVLEPLLPVDLGAGRGVPPDIAECVESEFHCRLPSFPRNLGLRRGREQAGARTSPARRNTRRGPAAMAGPRCVGPPDLLLRRGNGRARPVGVAARAALGNSRADPKDGATGRVTKHA